MEAYTSIVSILDKPTAKILLKHLEVSTELTVPQAKMLEVAGSALVHSLSRSRLSKFLELLADMSSVTIIGVPPSIAEKAHSEFVIHYFKILQQLLDTHSEIFDSVVELISNHIAETAPEALPIFVRSSQDHKNKYSREGSLIEAWSYFKNYPYKTAKLVLNHIDTSYLRERTKSSKFDRLHIRMCMLSASLIRQHPELIRGKSARIVEELFNNSKLFAKKYMMRKTNNDSLFLRSTELMIACLSNPYIDDVTMILRVSTPNEHPLINYLQYFLRELTQKLHKPDLAERILDMTYEPLESSLRANEDLLWVAALGLHRMLSSFEDNEDISNSLVKLISNLLRIDTQSTSDAFETSMSVGFIQSEIVPNLSFRPNIQLLSEFLQINTNPQAQDFVCELAIQRTKALPKSIYIGVLGEISKHSILDDFVHRISNLLLNECKKAEEEDMELIVYLQNLCVRSPNIVFFSTLEAISSVLKKSEKDKWIYEMNVSYASVVGKVTSMLKILKNCPLKYDELQSAYLVRECWSLLVHLVAQYDLKSFKNLMDFNDCLAHFASLTPLIFSKEEHFISGINIFEFEHRRFSTVFYSNLKTKISDIIGPKRAINKLEYNQLLFCYTVYKLHTWKFNSDKFYASVFEYLNCDKYSKHEKIIVAGLMEDLVMTYFDKSNKMLESSGTQIAADMVILLKNSVNSDTLIREISQELLLLECSRHNKGTKLKLRSCYSYQYPQIITKSQVFQTALDLLGSVHSQIDKHFDATCPQIVLPHCKSKLFIPSEQKTKVKVFDFLRRFVDETIGKALYLESTSVISALSRYTYTSNALFKTNSLLDGDTRIYNITNYSISHVDSLVYVFKQKPTCPFSPMVMHLNPTKFHNWFMKNLNKSTSEAKYGKNTEETQSITHNIFANDSHAIQMQVHYLSLAKHNLESYSAPLENLRIQLPENLSSSEDSNKMIDTLGVLTSLMILTEKPLAGILHHLIWAPVFDLSIRSVSISIFCWEWLLSSNIEHKDQIFHECWLVWRFMLKQGGIVKPVSYISPNLPKKKVIPHLESSAEFSSYELSETNLPLKNLIEIQLLMLRFFTTQFYVALTQSEDACNYIMMALLDLIEMVPNPHAMQFNKGLEVLLETVSFATSLAFEYTHSSNVINGNGLVDKVGVFLLRSFHYDITWLSIHKSKNLNHIINLFVKIFSIIIDLKAIGESEINYLPHFWGHPLTQDLTKQKHHVRPKILFSVSPTFTSYRNNNSVPFAINKELLLILLHERFESIVAWNLPNDIGKKVQIPSLPKPSDVELLITYAFNYNPILASNLVRCLEAFIPSKRREEYQETFETLILSKKLGEDTEEKLYLFSDLTNYSALLKLLNSGIDSAKSYAIKHLSRSPLNTQLFYLPQVIEVGYPRVSYSEYSRISSHEDIWTYLYHSASISHVFMNQLDYVLQVSLFKLLETFMDTSGTIGKVFLDSVLEFIKQDVQIWESYAREKEFFYNINMLSADLTPKHPDNRKVIQERLREMTGNGNNIPGHLFIPTNPDQKVKTLLVDSARTLQSAARIPVLINFITEGPDGHETTTPCIFKINDDVRNDQLCLQVVELMQQIFQKENLPLYLCPYKVISTVYNVKGKDKLGGMIECIPNTTSRDEIGKEFQVPLNVFYTRKFGAHIDQAKKNFIQSLAGYAIACYILQIKDRHNGNILIDKEGHIIHIDFGFILNISPGGNMRFERPGFKLTKEMLDIMGQSDEVFNYFKELVIRGYLAVRDHASAFIELIINMKDAGLSCYRKNAIQLFQKRFYMALPLQKVVKKMHQKIERANNSFFTSWYDRIQHMQQQVEY